MEFSDAKLLDHRRRRAAQGQDRADQGGGRRAACPTCRASSSQHTEDRRADGRQGRLVPRGDGGGRRRVPGRAARRRAPAVRALHERLDGQAEGHPAHHRRLPDAGRLDPQARLRPQARARTCTGARPTSAGSPATRYIVYGPLLQRRDVVMYEGAPDYPHKGIWWELCERYGVTIFYTAPTAIRACMKWGVEHVEKFDLSKLRLLGTVGEPINPKAWLWYRKVVGGERCPIVDTWWQTETGGDHDHDAARRADDEARRRPGTPLPGIDAAVLDEEGNEVDAGTQGLLALRRPWPGMLRTLFRDDDRFIETYFSKWDQDDLPRRRRREAATTTATSGSSGASTTSSTSPATACRPPRSSRRSSRTRRSPSRRSSASSRRGHRPVDRRVRHARGRRYEGSRRARRRDPRARRRADRQARAAQAHHLGRRPAQDALGQDHAPPAARHRRGPRARRRHDAARPGRHGAARGRRSRSARRGRGLSATPRSPHSGAEPTPRARARSRRRRSGGRHPARRPR